MSSDPDPLFQADSFYAVRDAAAALSISTKAVRGAIRRGDLIAHEFAGVRGARVRGAYLNAWLEASRVRPIAATAPETVRPELLDLVSRRPSRPSAAPAPERLPILPGPGAGDVISEQASDLPQAARDIGGRRRRTRLRAR